MCQSFLLKSKANDIVVGRSMELPREAAENILIRWHACKVPAETFFCSYVAQGTEGIGFTWKNKNAYIGITPFGEIESKCLSESISNGGGMTGVYATEAINDKGLSGSILTYDANMQWSTERRGGIDVYYLMFIDYLLGMFDTVAEVGQAFVDQNLNPFAPLGINPKYNQPVHYILHDKGGHWLVIEVDDCSPKLYGGDYLKNHKLELHANALNDTLGGLLTNAPSLKWHYNNLRQYLHLSPFDPGRDTDKGTTMTQTSHGAGMIGLPGDYTSPSRFIRLATLLRFATQPKNLNEAAQLANHMLNAATVIDGVVIESGLLEFEAKNDITQWVTIKILSGATPKMCCRTYWASPLPPESMYQEFNFDNFPTEKKYIALNNQPLPRQNPTKRKMASSNAVVAN